MRPTGTMLMYKLKLSSIEDAITINQRLPDGRGIRAIVNSRNVELEILEACYIALAKQCEPIAQYHAICVAIQSVQNINASVEFLTLTRSEIESIMLGFSLTKGNRPENWTRAVSFLSQLVNPEEIQEENKADDIEREIVKEIKRHDEKIDRQKQIRTD
jgi:hypothetical protein